LWIKKSFSIFVSPILKLFSPAKQKKQIIIKKLMYKKIVLVLAFLTLCQVGFAQKKWSLRECIDYALEHNLQLQQNGLNIKSNEVALLGSKMARLPNLNGSMGHSYNFGRSIDRFTNQFVNKRTQQNNFNLSSSVTLFNNFQQVNTIKQNELSLKASEYDVLKFKNDLMLNVVGAYLQIILNQEQENNSRRQLQSTQEQLDRTKKLIDAGLLPKANLYSLEAQKSNDELQIVSAQNSVMLSKLNLKQFLQLPAAEDFDIITPTIQEPSQDVLIKNTEEIYTIAETNQPQIQSADLQTERSKLGIDIAKASGLPSLSLSMSAGTGYSSAQSQFFEGDGTFSTITAPIGYLQNEPSQLVVRESEVANGEIVDFGFGKQLTESFSQRIGLTLSIPIFNNYQTKNSVQNAQITLENRRLTGQIVRNQLRQTIEQAYTDVQAAHATFIANQQSMKSLEESLRVVEQRFNLGAANATEYQVAKNNLNNARTTLLNAKYNYFFKLKILDFYEGKEITLE
jgi:outer membrane protein